MVSHLVEPGGQVRARSESRRLTGELGEDGLGNFLGQLGRADLPPGGGIDEVEVSVHQFGERILRLLAVKSLQQFLVTRAHC